MEIKNVNLSHLVIERCFYWIKSKTGLKECQEEGRAECQVSRFSPDIKFKIPIDVSRYRASQVDDFTRAGVKGRVHQIRNVLLVGNPFNSWLF